MPRTSAALTKPPHYSKRKSRLSWNSNCRIVTLQKETSDNPENLSECDDKKQMCMLPWEFNVPKLINKLEKTWSFCDVSKGTPDWVTQADSKSTMKKSVEKKRIENGSTYVHSEDKRKFHGKSREFKRSYKGNGSHKISIHSFHHKPKASHAVKAKEIEQVDIDLAPDMEKSPETVICKEDIDETEIPINEE